MTFKRIIATTYKIYIYKMKRLLLLIGILTAIAAGFSIWIFYKSGVKPRIANAEIATTAVKLGNIQSIVTAQGTLEPKDYVDVGAQVSGTVKKMHIDIGDAVKTDDLIAEIDPDVYEAQVRATEARLKQLQAQKIQQQALIKQAQWKYNRNLSLYKDKAVSKEVLQDAQISLEVAKANLLSLSAQIEEAESQLEGNKTNLNFTKIYAPMDGTVVDQLVQEGQTINANQTTPTIVQIANLDVMTAKAEVAEADVMKLQEGTPTYFTTLGSGERRWEGRVRQILPTPEEINDVVLYNVLVDVKNEDHSLLPGMTTQMFFVLASAENVPVIPSNALGRRVPQADTPDGRAYEIQIMGVSGQKTKVVIVSILDRTQAAVVSGLEVGERVISNSKQNSSSEGRNFRPRMRL